jgi:hypothetical protein
MRIGRVIIIPAVFVLSVAGAALSGPALSAVAGHPASVTVKSVPSGAAAVSAPGPGMLYDSHSKMLYD